MPCVPDRVVRLVHADHRGAGVGQAGRDRQQKRSGTPDDDASREHHPLTLQQGLSSTGGDHPRQIPTWERDNPVMSSGGDDESPAVHDRGVRVDGELRTDVVRARLDEPHCRVGVVMELVEPCAQTGEHRPVRVAVGVRTGSVPPVLSAGTRPGIQDGHPAAGIGRRDRRGQTGRSCTDHHQVVRAHVPSRRSS